jgi:hypothetical protein
MPIVQNQQLTEHDHRYNKQERPHFGHVSVQFEGISRRSWHISRGCGGPFAVGQRHRGAQASLDARKKGNELRD